MLSYFIKKNLLVSMLLLISTMCYPAQSKISNNNMNVSEITFRKDLWDNIKALAKKESKYIFVDAYTTWCGPCKLLKKTTFKDKNTADFYNKNFISFAVDMEEGEGTLLSQKWNVTSYPSLLFFTSEGKMIRKQIGFLNGIQLIELGKLILSTNN